jgi:hypothetical protein
VVWSYSFWTDHETGTIRALQSKKWAWGLTVLHMCDHRLQPQSRQELCSMLNKPEDSGCHVEYLLVLSIVQIKSFTSNTSHYATLSQSFWLRVRFSACPCWRECKNIFFWQCLNLPSVALICWVISCLEEGCITWHCCSEWFKCKGVVSFVILV